jgi:nucleolin
MADLETIIVKYLENKGHESTARLLRREAACGKGTLKADHTLDEVFNYYNAHPDKFPKFEAPRAVVPSSNKRKADQISNDNPGVSERMFIGNLSFKVTEELLKRHFASCGELVEIDFVKDKTSGKFYGTAFITFDTKDAAEIAMKMNGKDFLGRPVKMNYAPHRVVKSDSAVRKMPPAPKFYDRPEGCRTLFMGNLSFDVTEEQIREMFKKCGPMVAVRFLYRDNNDFKGCAFVEFEHETSLSDALKLHSKPLAGRPVRLDFA